MGADEKISRKRRTAAGSDRQAAAGRDGDGRTHGGDRTRGGDRTHGGDRTRGDGRTRGGDLGARAGDARPISRQREAGEVTRRETRRRLLVAAGLEFAERGYVAATVNRIAERAGVSLQSLYSAWGSKRALLRAVMESAVTGEPESGDPLQAGEPPAPLRAELRDDDVSDPREFVARLAHLYRRLAERSAIGWRTYRDAAAVDPEIAADWRQLMDIRRANVTAVAGRIPVELLRAGLTVPTAGDTVWAIASPDTHEMLVRQAGYSYDAYEDWVRQTLCAALLRD